MNDREQTRLLGNLSVGFFGGFGIVLYLYWVYYVEPLGVGILMYVVAGVMNVAMIVASLLLVREQVTRWEATTSDIDLLRSRSRDCLLVVAVALQYQVLPDQWQLIAAVVIAPIAAFATVWLSRPIYNIAHISSISHAR